MTEPTYAIGALIQRYRRADYRRNAINVDTRVRLSPNEEKYAKTLKQPQDADHHPTAQAA